MQIAKAENIQTVLVRDNHFRPVFIEESMPDLESNSRFDGRYFKVVNNKSDEAISLTDADEELRLRAATTYYHLNKARRYWVEEMNSEYVKNMDKITVRINITNKFSDLGHFQHDSIDPQFNNALSIPAGTPMEGVDIPAWGNEIWFRPVKIIRTEDLPPSGLDSIGNPLTKYLSMLSNPLTNSIINRVIQISLQKIFYPQTLLSSYKNSVLKQFGIFAAIRLLLEGSKRSEHLLMAKYFYLDTAMIPEIIYHEFSHVALSDRLALSLSTPMLEGMADFFATSISENPKIGSKIRHYSMSQPKNAKNKSPYSPVFETNLFANSDFVLSVLWKIGEGFPEMAEQLIYQSRTRLATETSDIRHDLIRAILDSCNEVCADPRADRMRLREIFEEKGF